MLSDNKISCKEEYLQRVSEDILLRPDYWKIYHDTWRIYRYGHGIKVVYIKSGNESKKSNVAVSLKPLSAEEKSERLSQSVSRTKSTIFELAFCNEFDYFCTFTLDEEKVSDRYDLKTFRKDLAQFVRNLNRSRDEKIKYLFVPEQHKDGAWHLHGLVKGLTGSDLKEFNLSERLPHKIRQHIKNGEKVYNWEKYSKKFGFFTATPIKSHDACAKYITKYITKDVMKNNLESGAHSFFASQGLQRKTLVLQENDERCPLEKWGFENEYVKTAWFDSEEDFLAALSKKNGQPKITS